MVFCHLCLMKHLLITYVVDFWCLSFFLPVVPLIQALTLQAILHSYQHVLGGWTVAFLNTCSIPFTTRFCVKILKIIQGEVVCFFFSFSFFSYSFSFSSFFFFYYYFYHFSSKKINIHLRESRWKSTALGVQGCNTITEGSNMKVAHCKVSNYWETSNKRLFIKNCNVL